MNSWGKGIINNCACW